MAGRLRGMTGNRPVGKRPARLLVYVLGILLLWACPNGGPDREVSMDRVPQSDAAADDDEGSPVPRVGEGRSPATASGQVAYLDPKTGRLTASRPPGSRPPLVRTLPHGDVRVKTLPDGTLIAERPGGFRSTTVAAVDARGKVGIRHASRAPEHGGGGTAAKEKAECRSGGGHAE